MADVVKPKRLYRSDRRGEQAHQTRVEILDAGRRLFLTDGYAGTTLKMVAAQARVSVPTVYKAFANKPGLVKALIDVAIVGDDKPIPMMQRDFVLTNIAEPDPRKKLANYGAHVGAVGSRANPLLLVVRDAGASDPGAAAVWSQLQTERLTGMTSFAQHLAAANHLRPNVSRAEARDVLWTHNSVELWDLLVKQRHWANKRFGHWIGQQLIAALL